MLSAEAGALPSTKSLKFNQTEISEGSAKTESVICKRKVKIPSLNGRKDLHGLVSSLNVPRSVCVRVRACVRVCVCVCRRMMCFLVFLVILILNFLNLDAEFT